MNLSMSPDRTDDELFDEALYTDDSYNRRPFAVSVSARVDHGLYTNIMREVKRRKIVRSDLLREAYECHVGLLPDEDSYKAIAPDDDSNNDWVEYSFSDGTTPGYFLYTLTCEVSADLRHRLDQEAERRGVSLSEVIREALTVHYGTYGCDEDDGVTYVIPNKQRMTHPI